LRFARPSPANAFVAFAFRAPRRRVKEALRQFYFPRGGTVGAAWDFPDGGGRGASTMADGMQGQYFLRYQRSEQTCPFEERFATERQAVVEAFAKITQNFIVRVWIEDERGRVIINEEDIRDRCRKEVLT
jgi:hypothetical protein